MEFLLTVSRDRPGTLTAQIQSRIRDAVRNGSLRAGAPVPSTRDLARQLGVSRKVTVDAYAQLAAEGYLALRQGAQPRVAPGPFPDAAPAPEPVTVPPARFDFLPARPDVSSFPRAAWIRCLRDAVNEITVDDLGYGDVFGVAALRDGLADYLGRVRGVVAGRDRIMVTSGFQQSLGLICRALAARGARRIACEDPGNREQARIVARAGLEPVHVPVDHLGLKVDLLAVAQADAVILTPAHQHPTGVVLAPERRTALIAWLRACGAIAIEDDYDAEYRYDRPAVGALQGLDQNRVVYAGTLSKVLAPALRLGWMVLPPALVDYVREEKLLHDQGTARIEQLALAHFLRRGELDRHLRRMRLRYRRRRDAMIAALAESLPEATVRGIAAGLHVTVQLPNTADETDIAAHARSRGIALATMSDYRSGGGHPPTLILGYSQMTESRLRSGIRELAAGIHRPANRR
ncbi:GntR family transcriptional regulator/MocR family aminotransferase [Actinoplanes campanulatus]|uniref:GntR family transcriptional regulator/MocR family aminotransferase n=1 Tax=Actinoplanes campanulatus TaxID=113559 RepID=A0A7W5AR68_9ACTN|nr:PLP-dependent aminotransferase family protein [Actinoplanes campanulatus]MBB3100732.1 GntR family transcriptional regulator/MocR family aminotransferase [Actinoplanes campanulatus]GGN46059.1 GntR family transcriptional regulator [Actinoplanes campanulatus]GID41206.1 GntR family transcriptional regulator [Actinoplanes campanulatus]